MGLDNWGSHKELWRIKNAFQEAQNPGLQQRICRRLAAVLVDCSSGNVGNLFQNATGRGEGVPKQGGTVFSSIIWHLWTMEPESCIGVTIPKRTYISWRTP